ncbi:hypothetical protein IAU60_006255 [Kwoniella sp. DSM 27419]
MLAHLILAILAVLFAATASDALALSSPTPSATAPPLASATSQFPSPTLAPVIKRCDLEPCSFGGQATTLQASVVTSTILSTTSVPCYITTFVTDSKTVTQTVYSTEIITSTMTKEGTVFIIQYSPTPVLMSTPVTSVMEITNTWWSYWMATEGSAYQVTSKGPEQTLGGGVCDTCNLGSGWSSGSGSGSGAAPPANGGQGAAWTHLGANAAQRSFSGAGSGGGWVGATIGTGSGSGYNRGIGGYVNWSSGPARTPRTSWLRVASSLSLPMLALRVCV